MRKSKQLPIALIACVLALIYLGVSVQRYLQPQLQPIEKSELANQQSTVVAPSSIETPRPNVNLNIELHGVIINSNPDASTAIISLNGAEQVSYRPGETLTANVTLDQINFDSIVINSHGQQQTIELSP